MRAKQAGMAIAKSEKKGPGKFARGIRFLFMLSIAEAAALTIAGFDWGFSKEDVNAFKEEFISYETQAWDELKNYLATTVFHKENETQIGQEVSSLAQAVGEEANLGDFQRATIVRVVDGDTIVVEIEGEKAKVRMIGVDTPESVASQEYLDKTGKENTQEGKDASDFTKELLSHYDDVYLLSDQGDTDKYGRLLRYVWLSVPEEITKETIETQMVQGVLLANGYAKPMTIAPNTTYAWAFEEIASDYEAERE